MVVKKTPIGGLFSIIYFIALFQLIAFNLNNFLLGNKQELKSLVPVVSVQESYPKIASDLAFEVLLFSYGGACSTDQFVEHYTTCHAAVKWVVRDILPLDARDPVPTPQCKKATAGCYVRLTCN